MIHRKCAGCGVLVVPAAFEDRRPLCDDCYVMAIEADVALRKALYAREAARAVVVRELVEAAQS